MGLVEEILQMYYEENLSIGEIASALKQSPCYVYSIIYKR